MLQEKKNL